MNIGICIKGLEDISAEETNGKKIAKGRIKFDEVKDYRSLKLIYELKGSFRFKGAMEIIRNIAKVIDFKGSFMVSCHREGEHKFNSGKIIKGLTERFSKKNKIDYKNPKNVVYVDIIDNKCMFGFLVKKDMHKREYRVKLRGMTVHPCVAYSMLKMIDLKKNESFLDPRCGDGVIVIEASFISKKVYGVDRNIRDTRINAKIAKVEINLSEELKVKKVKKIATYLPCISKTKREGMISNIYEKFFTEMKKILGGRMAILVEKRKLLKKFAKDFKLLEERKIFVGDAMYYILVFER